MKIIKMNHHDIYQSAGERLVPETNLRQGLQTFQTRAKMFRTLIEERKWPKDGWDDLSVELFLNELASMDSNNFPSKGGVGEREGRIYSSLVAKRHFRLSHGIGRSGNLTEVQPKATGSSLMNALTNALLLDLCKMQGSRKVTDAFLVPMATGMTLALVLLTLKKENPEGKYVIWPRIDQKSCFKSMLTAGLEPLIIEPILHGEELQTNINSITDMLNLYGPKILCVMTTTSCFSPRSCDNLEQVSKLCKENNVFHVVNNAYGLQSGKCAYAIQQAQKFGRLDIFVQSTDKNLLVPVGGAVVAGFDEKLINKIRSNYAGRASSSPVTDVFITMLSMGSTNYTQLLKDRTENFKYLKARLQALGQKFGEHVIESPGNQISLGLTLKRLGAGLETKERNVVLTELGSMLFLRNVCGSRVITTHEKKSIEGYEFEGWGANCKNYLFPYITAAASIGMTKMDIDFFIEKLEECIFKLKKKHDLLEMFDVPPRELSETTVL